MYSFASFFVFTILGPFVGAMFLSPGHPDSGLFLALVFFPFALAGGLLPTVGAWLLGIAMSLTLRGVLLRCKPDWLLRSEKATRLRNAPCQLLAGTVIGAASGYLMYLATHNLSMYKPTLPGHGIDFQYVDTMAGLVCGLISAAIALRRPRDSNPEARPEKRHSPGSRSLAQKRTDPDQ
jgi:hypothetical protein